MANHEKANYTLNHIDRTIVMKRAFAKEAGTHGTTEYDTLVSLMRDFPGYRPVEKTIKESKNKQTYKGLDYQRMEDYIKLVAPEVCGQLYTVMEMAKTRNGRYAFVKNWFLKKFPDYLTDKDFPAVA